MNWDTMNLANRPIRVLIFEDNPADAKLMLHALHKGGFSVQSDAAKSSTEFKQFMQSKHFDVILADYYVPGWTGIDAIRWTKKSGHATPIILVTGSLGDEQAVACIKEGASDFVLKDKLDHLAIAVTHAIEEQALREARDSALEKVRQSAEQYRLLFNCNPQPMWVYDLETLRFEAINDSAIHHYGYSRDEFLGMTIKDIRPPEDVPKLLATFAEGRSREQLENAGTWRHRKKNGDIIYVKITEGSLTFLDRPAALICIEDVSERQILERQFLQAQKMEAVGRLAGGVAHDFNNLLMIIGSSAQLLQDGLARKKDNVDKYVNTIRQATDKAAGLTRQLLAFSRQQVLQPTVLDLNAVVSDLSRMLPRLLGEDIEMIFSLPPHLGRINADRGQIEQIIMNLAVNARDAMPHGGKLTIETTNVDLDQEYIGGHGVKGRPGSYVMLAVTDTGTGMSQEVQSRIFEPFFTTKELGKGTGLGLATVYGIVKQSGGWIWAYSEVGHGSSFKVYLPRTEEAVPQPQAKDSFDSLHGTETILLVEDEDALREVTGDYLEDKGYRVLKADSGPQAVEILSGFDGTIHALITDMVMPGFGGPKLAEACLAKAPDTRIIFVSGYAEGSINQEIVGKHAIFLQKPFSLNLLGQKLRLLLNNTSNPNT